MYQYRSDHNAVFQASRFRVAWKTQLAGKINGGLAVVGTQIYVASFDHNLYSIDVSTGMVRWRAELPNISMSTPIVADNLVIVGTGSNAVLSDSASSTLWGNPSGDVIAAFERENGKLFWMYKTVGEDMPSPVFVNTKDEIVFSNGDGHVRALHPRTGTLYWERPIFGVATMSSLAVYNDVIFGGSNLGAENYYALQKVPGRVQFRTRTWVIDPLTGQYTWMAPFGSSDCSPTISGGTVFVSSADPVGRIVRGDFTFPIRDSVQALNARDGRLLWSYTAPTTGANTTVGTNEVTIAGSYADRTFFVSLPAVNEFKAFDGRTGRVQWTVSTVAAVKMSAVVSGGRAYFGDTAGIFYVVDEHSGRVIGATKFPSFFSCSSPVIVGDSIFIANNSALYSLPLDELESGTMGAPTSIEKLKSFDSIN